MDDVEKQIRELKLSFHFFEWEEKIKIIEEQYQNNIQAQTLIADWSHFIMDFERADSLNTAILKRDSANIAAINGRAMVALDNDQVERSIELIKKAIKIDSTHSISWVNYSKVLLEIRNSEGVIASLNKAIECDSLNAQAFARKGFYYAALRYDMITILLSAFFSTSLNAQSKQESLEVLEIVSLYNQGYYEGDSAKMSKVLHPELVKRIM